MGVRYEKRSVLVERKQTAGGTCDICGKELELVFPGTSYHPTTQFSGASIVAMRGWYGGFIDPIDDSGPEWLLCDICSGRIWAILGPQEGYR